MPLSIQGAVVQGRERVYSVFGVENPLMDVIAHVDYEFLERFRKQPGSMHLVDHHEIEVLLRQLPSSRTLPGGSAANTTRGVAWLASPAGKAVRGLFEDLSGNRNGDWQPVFNGAVGRDAIGDRFIEQMTASGVEASIVRKETPTGTSVILVTPDGERTMNTYLGACRDFGPEDLDLERLTRSRILYLTGYLWDTAHQDAAARKAAEVFRADGGRKTVAFDLADSFAVRRSGEAFRSWIPGHVDVLFGNRDEIAILTGAFCDEDCMHQAEEFAPLIVMKVGEKGCIVGQKGEYTLVPGVPVRVVDTTGAGDAFAAGFLYGMLQGAEPVLCARLANTIASRVVGREGCSYD
ncbi:MAG: adenosine kinase [Spirochaetia bacterium]